MYIKLYVTSIVLRRLSKILWNQVKRLSKQ